MEKRHKTIKILAMSDTHDKIGKLNIKELP